MENYYKYFGVKENASGEEIKQAYLSLIKKYHPDIYQGDKFYAEQKTAEINKRYSILKDEKLRKEYDSKLQPQKVVNTNNIQHHNNRASTTAKDVDNIFIQMFKRLKNAFAPQKNQKSIKTKQKKENKKQKIKKIKSEQKTQKIVDREKFGLTFIILLIVFVILAFIILITLI